RANLLVQRLNLAPRVTQGTGRGLGVGQRSRFCEQVAHQNISDTHKCVIELFRRLCGATGLLRRRFLGGQGPPKLSQRLGGSPAGRATAVRFSRSFHAAAAPLPHPARARACSVRSAAVLAPATTPPGSAPRAPSPPGPPPAPAYHAYYAPRPQPTVRTLPHR